MQLTMRAAVTLAVAAAWSGAAYAQGLRVVKPKAPTPSPVIAPEPRARVPVNPSTIFQNLISESSANRRLGLSQLGWKDGEQYADDPTFIGNARFDRVNLDDDQEMEAILMVDLGLGRQTDVLIFKKTAGAWWRVGIFSLDYMWSHNDAEHMLELLNIVDFDHIDIVVRVTGGGSDIQKAIDLSIYRLYAGRLYRTFNTRQEFALRKFLSPDKTVIEDECNRVFYPEIPTGEPAYIVVHHTKQTVPDQEWGVIERTPKLLDCTPHRWNAVKYQFVADPSAARKFCPVGK